MPIFKHVFLATMFLELVSTISQNWLDQLRSTSAYIFSIQCGYRPYHKCVKIFNFFHSGSPKKSKKCVKIETQSSKCHHFLNFQYLSFNIFRSISFILVLAIAEDIQIRNPFEFFVSDDQKPSNSGHRMGTAFFQKQLQSGPLELTLIFSC